MEAVIGDALSALLAADYPPDRLTIVAIDDRSTDNTGLIVDAFAGGIASPVGLITFVLASGLAFGALTSRPLRHAA